MAEDQYIYYIQASFGCGLRLASDLEIAQADALREIGTYAYLGVRPATKDDLIDVEMMGGYVPDGRLVSGVRR